MVMLSSGAILPGFTQVVLPGSPPTAAPLTLSKHPPVQNSMKSREGPHHDASLPDLGKFRGSWS